MTLTGNAFLIMWHDIAPEGDAEYNLWHTQEHMPERIDLPGFRRARRGVNRGAARQVYFTLYEGDGLETFVTPEYQRSLNEPTDWTQRVAPTFRNFIRMVCRTASTGGRGQGGALTTLRCGLGGADAPALEDALSALAAIPSVTAVHVGEAQQDVSARKTTETALRPAMQEAGFDLVIMVEGIGLAELARDESLVAAAVEPLGFADVLIQSYDVAYTLTDVDA
jgi:hypothetical protein